jgi:hypothetical protein
MLCCAHPGDLTCGILAPDPAPDPPARPHESSRTGSLGYLGSRPSTRGNAPDAAAAQIAGRGQPLKLHPMPIQGATAPAFPRSERIGISHAISRGSVKNVAGSASASTIFPRCPSWRMRGRLRSGITAPQRLAPGSGGGALQLLAVYPHWPGRAGSASLRDAPAVLPIRQYRQLGGVPLAHGGCMAPDTSSINPIPSGRHAVGSR